MNVAYQPERPHQCLVGPSGFGLTAQGGSLDWWHDRPGTVRECDCGRLWVAERWPTVLRGQQMMGVYWRPARWRERRKIRRVQP